MSEGWLERRERGSLAGMRLMTWLTLALGYRFARALLYPICIYFLVFSPAARRASRDFLARALGRTPSAREVFRHFHVFASTLLDRVALGAGDHPFEVRVQGAGVLESLLANRRGCMLLGSHLGSFEILRVLGESRRRLAVNLVMHEGNARKTSQWLRALSPELGERIIAPGRPDTALRIRECLERGEVVALLGDRVLRGERSVSCRFFGADARFPAGPILTAAILEVPVVSFFCLYRGPRCYDVHFELLAERVASERPARDAAVAACLARYVALLESHARAAPHNWFNFYDFWRAS